MNTITSLTDLEKAFSIESLSNVTDYDSHFRMLAESLINNFQIRSGNDVYRLVEIEFYLRKTEAADRKIAYERETCAGDWFIHDNGFDLSFESYKDFYGGILIRSVKRSKSFYETGEFINGPRKCLWNLVDGLNAFGHNIHTPLIEEASVKDSLEVRSFTRQGIKEDDKLFRFTIPLNIWEHKGYTGFPKK